VLILPSNLSTTALIFIMVLMLAFVGNYPIKYMAIIVGLGVLVLGLFFITAKVVEKTNPNHAPKIFQRVKTWENRVTNHFKENPDDEDDNYQIDKAKIAIATGGIYGLGPGKSVQKTFCLSPLQTLFMQLLLKNMGL